MAQSTKFRILPGPMHKIPDTPAAGPVHNPTRRCARCGRVRPHHHGAEGPWPWTVPLPEPITTRAPRACPFLTGGIAYRSLCRCAGSSGGKRRPPYTPPRNQPHARHPVPRRPRLPIHTQCAAWRVSCRDCPVANHVRAGVSGRQPSRHRPLHTVPSLLSSRQCASGSIVTTAPSSDE